MDARVISAFTRVCPKPAIHRPTSDLSPHSVASIGGHHNVSDGALRHLLKRTKLSPTKTRHAHNVGRITKIYLSSSRVPARPLGVGVAAPAEPHRIEVDAS